MSTIWISLSCLTQQKGIRNNLLDQILISITFTFLMFPSCPSRNWMKQIESSEFFMTYVKFTFNVNIDYFNNLKYSTSIYIAEDIIIWFKEKWGYSLTNSPDSSNTRPFRRKRNVNENNILMTALFKSHATLWCKSRCYCKIILKETE